MQTVTFYSYKGGTGRTLLLANMARVLASLGKRVVAIDFDLEAPGLPYKLIPGDLRPSSGLVGWLRDALAGQIPEALGDYLVEVDVRDPMVPGGWLKLMPSGRAPSPNYFQDLLRLRLDERLDDGTGIDVLVTLQSRLASDLEADYLLIDARTGITPTNAVTTHVLADAVVVLALDTTEQLEGTRSVLRSLQPLTSIRTEDPIRVTTILSRVPGRDPTLGGRTEEELQRLERVRGFLNEPAEPLAKTLNVDEIHLLHMDTELIRQEFVSWERPSERSKSLLHADYGRVAEAIFGAELVEARAEALRRAGPDQVEAIREHLEALSESEHGDGGVDLRNVGEEHIAGIGLTRRSVEPRSAGEHVPEIDEREREQAAESVETVRHRITQGRRAGDERSVTEQLRVLGQNLSRLGRLDEAAAAISEAIETYRSTGNRSDAALAEALGELGSVFTKLDRHEEALELDIESTEILQRLVDEGKASTVDLAKRMYDRGIDLRELDRLDDALASFRESAEAARRAVTELDEDGMATFLKSSESSADMLEALGQADAAFDVRLGAWELLEEKLDVVPDIPRIRLAIFVDLAGDLRERNRRPEAVSLLRVIVERLGTEIGPDLRGQNAAAMLHNVGVELTRLGMESESPRTAALAAQARRWLIGRCDSEADEAINLNRLVVELAVSGQFSEAYDLAVQAVQVWRRLAEQSPEHENGLADALDALTDVLRERGDRSSIDVGREAVALRRKLDEDGRLEEDSKRTFAGALVNLGLELVGEGQADAGIALIREGADRWRALYANDRGVAPLLAASLNALADVFRQTGRGPEALPVMLESVELRRVDADDVPGSQVPLARALMDLATVNQQLGLLDPAEKAAREAVMIYDGLADQPGADVLERQVRARENLTSIMRAKDDSAAARLIGEDVIAEYRVLFEAEPDRFRDPLARALHNVSLDCLNLGDYRQARVYSAEAVALRQDLSQDDAEARARRAATLAVLGQAMAGDGLEVEAIEPLLEAADLFRQVAAEDPSYQSRLATTLAELASRMQRADRAADAIKYGQEAVDAFRELGERVGLVGQVNLGAALNNLGIFLASAGQTSEALAASEESLRVYRKVASDHGLDVRREIAQTLAARAEMLQTAGDLEDAAAVRTEAVTSVRQLADTATRQDLLWLANLLARHSDGLALLGDAERANALAAESADIINTVLGDQGEPPSADT